jgi:replicative DNA helicase
MKKVTLLPNNPDYERAILSLLIGPTSSRDDHAEIFDSLSEEDFYNERHKKIFVTCRQLHELKAPIDAVTVTEALENKIDGMWGSFISQIIEVLPASDIQFFSGKLRTYSTTRKALDLSSKFIDMIKAPGAFDNLNELLDAHQRDILQLGIMRNVHGFERAYNLAVDTLQRYRDLSLGHTLPALPTGYEKLDRLIHLRGSKLVIIAARPSVGKTAFAGNLIRNLAAEEHKTALFELEMDGEEILDRWISMETGINLVKISHGRLAKPEEWTRILQANENISKWPVLIDDEGGLQISELKRRIRIAKKEGCEIVFIDQLSQIRGPGSTEYERNTWIVQELSKLKKELHIPIVLLCQINRKIEESSNKKPRLTMLKTTGALEEEADIALLLDRPYTYTGKPEDRARAIIDVAKQRGGPTGSIEIEWDGSTVTFREKEE